MVLEMDGNTLKAWIDDEKKMVIIDARDKRDYKKAHIPKSISLLNSEVEKRADKLLESGLPVIVYSNDENCPASGLVAAKLDKMGYNPVYDYNPSYADWVKRGYPTVS